MAENKTKRQLALELALKMKEFKETQARLFGGSAEFNVELAALTFEKNRTKREIEIALKTFE